MNKLAKSPRGKTRNSALKRRLGYLRLLMFWSDLPRTKYVVVTEARSGTGLLATLMSQHPDILVENEIFHRNITPRVRSPALYLKARSRKAVSRNKSAYGFKLFYHHLVLNQSLSDARARAFIVDLHAQGWKIIYLRRNNILRRALSGISAKARNLLHIRDQQTLEKVHIDGQQLMNWIALAERVMAIDEDIMAQVDHLLVEYETDLLNPADHPRTCSRIFKYLDLPDIAVGGSRLRKMSTEDLSRTIENYAEIQALLKDTQHAQSLLSSDLYPLPASIASQDKVKTLANDPLVEAVRKNPVTVASSARAGQR